MNLSRIRTMTYNAGLLKFFFRDLVPFVNARANILPKTLVDLVDKNSLDVIFLQEVWNERIARTIEASLHQRNFHVIRPRVSKFIGSGIILAIRRPLRLLSQKFFPFRIGAS